MYLGDTFASLHHPVLLHLFGSTARGAEAKGCVDVLQSARSLPHSHRRGVESPDAAASGLEDAPAGQNGGRLTVP